MGVTTRGGRGLRVGVTGCGLTAGAGRSFGVGGVCAVGGAWWRRGLPERGDAVMAMWG